ncbi:MAG: signal recognition particle receptor subunit alpha, partial [Rubrivivax sp.]
MFSFFKKKLAEVTPATPEIASQAPAARADAAPPAQVPQPATAPTAETAEPDDAARAGWMQRLRQGLRKTGTGISHAFTGARIDDALYEELEAALLMADAGLPATQYLLVDLKRRVKDARASDAGAVKQLLVEALTSLLKPLE